MRGRLLGFPLFLAVGAWRLTLRIRLFGVENRDAITARGLPSVHALWHQRMVIGILTYFRTGCVTIASKSSDGDVIAGFLRFWGFRVVRGSSSRRGAGALRELIASLSGTTGFAAVTTDGPRGPARRSKPGIVALADTLGSPVIPVGTSATRPLFLRSWDRYLLPLPFSRCVVVFAPPVSRLPGESDDELLARLDRAIDDATEEADRRCGVANAPRERLRANDAAEAAGAEAAEA